MLHRVYLGLEFASPQGFMIFLGFGVLALVLTSLGVRLVSIFAISRFANMRAYSLSSQLIESYLRQPYTWFLGRNSAQLSKTILIEVQRVVNQAIMPVMTTISQAALVLSLFGLLLVMEPVIALTAVGLFGGSYVLVYLVTRRVLAWIGEVIIKSNDARFKAVHEVMTSIKDVKILGVERPFMQRFCEPTRRMAMVQAQGAVISEAPRYVLEAMALGGMLVLILHLLFNGSGTLVDILPTLGIFAFAGMRLFPALQTIYRELGTLRVSKPAVDELYADMMETRAGALGLAGGGRGPAARARRPARARRRRLRLSGGQPHRARRPRPRGPGALDARHRRRHRRRQDHARRRDPRPALARRGRDPGRRRQGHPGEPARLAGQHRLRAAAESR